MADVLAHQTLKRGEKPSTITVKPTVQWPTFGDADHDADTFFEDFEEICALANNSKGMSFIEMIRTLGGCLKGSRKQAYTVEVKAARQKGHFHMHPETVYNSLAKRLTEFKEGVLEKQQRLSREWAELKRGKKTALEVLPIFDSMVSEMELAGRRDAVDGRILFTATNLPSRSARTGAYCQ